MGRAYLPQTSRRAATAVEFGLLLPVVLGFVLGIIDFGWAFHEHGIITRALRDGCRAGAVVPATGNPVTTATAAIEAAMSAAGFACGSGACTATSTLDTVGSMDVLECTLSVPVLALTGFTSALGGLTITTATRVHIESWESP